MEFPTESVNISGTRHLKELIFLDLHEYKAEASESNFDTLMKPFSFLGGGLVLPPFPVGFPLTIQKW